MAVHATGRFTLAEPAAEGYLRGAGLAGFGLRPWIRLSYENAPRARTSHIAGQRSDFVAGRKSSHRPHAEVIAAILKLEKYKC